jgi:hypothetical protein
MKLTNRPNVDDLHELQKLANRETLGSYPDLMHAYIVIRDQYRSFLDNGGDPWKIFPVNLAPDLKNRIKGHYSQPPKDCLEFISDVRYKSPSLVCLMCGGAGMGTLDHYLPKDIYPEFSIFSANLVPACNCNSLRRTTHKGQATPQRVIHPYFDQFVTDRLYQAKFEGDFMTPQITIEVIDDTHPNYETIKFHLESVILNDSTHGWLEKYWSALALRPDDILELVLPDITVAIDSAILTTALTRFRNSKDKEFGTLNNWYSMFYTGLLADINRLDTLANYINQRRA